MENQDFSTTLLVDQSPEKAFEAITNPRAWWSEEITGGTSEVGDVFDYHYKDVHICKFRLAEVIPNQKVVWHCLENHFDFVKDQSEWVGTNVIFEISKSGDKTQIAFTHQGLVPQHECFEICQDAWTGYIQDSLGGLIATGKGAPNPKES
jgi:uncharacterized protein YndB with AHSA1/START domain